MMKPTSKEFEKWQQEKEREWRHPTDPWAVIGAALIILAAILTGFVAVVVLADKLIAMMGGG